MENITKTSTDIHLMKVDFIIHTEVSVFGLGAIDGFSSIGGRWVKHENGHINYLELKATLNYHLWW